MKMRYLFLVPLLFVALIVDIAYLFSEENFQIEAKIKPHFFRHHHICFGATGAPGAAGMEGPPGANAILTFATACSQTSQSLPFVDLTAPSNTFILFPTTLTVSPSEISFSSLAFPNIGTLIHFHTAGTYLIKFYVSTNSEGLPAGQQFALGLFKGSKGEVPNTLPQGHLFLGGIAAEFISGEIGGALISGFTFFTAAAGETLTLGNAENEAISLLSKSYNSGTTHVNSTTASLQILKLQ